MGAGFPRGWHRNTLLHWVGWCPHAHLFRWLAATDGFTRPVWDWDAQLGGSLFDCSIEELVRYPASQVQGPFETVSQQAKRVMESLGKAPDAFGLIHADLVPENVLFKAGDAYPIDFEDCGYGYWMDDIAVALCPWVWGEDWERMRDAFREGIPGFAPCLMSSGAA